jgi:hypothetical protein
MRPRRWGPEKCLWNALERQSFPILEFPGRAQWALGGAERRSPEKIYTSEDQKLAAGCIILETAVEQPPSQPSSSAAGVCSDGTCHPVG